MPKTIVYADGLNLYHTLERFDRRLMWVDVSRLVETMLGDGYDIVRVNYYTAPFSINPMVARQQADYHKALKSYKHVEIHRGYFKGYPKWGKLTTKNDLLPLLSWFLPDLLQTKILEEKKTDVSLATHLVRDAFCKHCEVAVMITNDGDFEEAIRVVTKEANLPVYLLSPAGLGRRGAHGGLRKEATRTIHITKGHLEIAQFPRVIKLANGKRIVRPSAWG